MKRADWSLWSQIPTAALWEAVALSLDIEPASLPRPEIRGADPFTEASDEYRRRLRIACSHVEDDQLACLTYGEAWRNRLRLAAFAAWAKAQGWKVPAHMPCDAGNGSSPADEKRGRHMWAALQTKRKARVPNPTAQVAAENNMSTTRVRQLVKPFRDADAETRSKPAGPFDGLNKR